MLIGAKDACDFFNWYFSGSFLCGDLTTRPMRQDEYVKERLAYTNPLASIKRDRAFIKAHSCERRYCVFVRLRFIKVCDHDEFLVYDIDEQCERRIRVRNMDAFFYFSDARRKMQEAKIDEFLKVTV